MPVVIASIAGDNTLFQLKVAAVCIRLDTVGVLKQALNFSAETRNSAVFGDFWVIPEVSANLVKKIFGGGG